MRLLDANRLALMVALGLGACTTTTASRTQDPEGQATTQAAEAQVSDDQLEAGLREYHRYQHRGGLVQFVAMGLDTLAESEAERPQVEQLQRDLFTCMAPAGAIQLQLHLKIAEGVAAGAVDLAQVDALIGQLDKAADGVRECSVVTLGKLHALLTPEERSELGDKVQANLEVWQEVTSKDGQLGRGPGGRLGRLTKEVALTPDQVEQATAALHTALSGQPDRYDRSKVEEDVQAFDAAFELPSFDAKAATRYVDPRTASHAATRMAIFYETVTPLLTPAQRAQLAERLRARAAKHPTI